MGAEENSLAVEAVHPRYTLNDLLVQCDSKAPLGKDRAWVRSPFVGRELI